MLVAVQTFVEVLKLWVLRRVSEEDTWVEVLCYEDNLVHKTQTYHSKITCCTG